jgi:hypothetical protein
MSASAQPDVKVADALLRWPMSSLDHVAGTRNQFGWHCYAKPPGGLKVDYKFWRQRGPDWQIARIGFSEDFVRR